MKFETPEIKVVALVTEVIANELPEISMGDPDA